MSSDSTPQIGLPIEVPSLTSSFIKKLLIDGGFEAHKVSVIKRNMHMAVGSLDELVGNLMVVKAVLAPDYTDEELKEFVPILKKEVLKLEGLKDFGGPCWTPWDEGFDCK
jgi:hypothetical protein